MIERNCICACVAFHSGSEIAINIACEAPATKHAEWEHDVLMVTLGYSSLRPHFLLVIGKCLPFVLLFSIHRVLLP